MEQLLASRSASVTELKRNPRAILEQAGNKPVAVLSHNRPAAYLVSPQTCEAMLKGLDAGMRVAIQEGIDSGPAIAADQVLVELQTRYGEPQAAPGLEE